MVAAEIHALAGGPEIGGGVLDLCSGVRQQGRLVAAETAAAYLGINRDQPQPSRWPGRPQDLPCRFEVGVVTECPRAFDVVLLLETLLAFRDKEPVLAGVATALQAAASSRSRSRRGHPRRGSGSRCRRPTRSGRSCCPRCSPRSDDAAQVE